jgi:hypothetical protein
MGKRSLNEHAERAAYKINGKPQKSVGASVPLVPGTMNEHSARDWAQNETPRAWLWLYSVFIVESDGGEWTGRRSG